ncbi:MAG: hypothetical protein AB8C84_03060 [Oligoflexales bacterium]
MFQDIQYKLQWLNRHPEAQTFVRMCEELRTATHSGVALDIAYASARHHTFRHCVQFLSTLVETLGGAVDQLGLLRLMEMTDAYVERPDLEVPGFFEAVLVEASCAYDQKHLILDLGVGAGVVDHLNQVAQRDDVDGFREAMEKFAVEANECPWALDLKRIRWCVPGDVDFVPELLMNIGLVQPVELDDNLWKWLCLGQMIEGTQEQPSLTLRGYNLSAAYYAFHSSKSVPWLYRLHPCWQAARVKFAAQSQLEEWFENQVPMHPIAFGQCAERQIDGPFFHYTVHRLRKGATADVRMQAAEILASMPPPFQDRVQEVLKEASSDPVPKVRLMLQGLCSRMEK